MCRWWRTHTWHCHSGENANVSFSLQQLSSFLLRMSFVGSEERSAFGAPWPFRSATPSQDCLSGRMAWADESVAVGQFQHLATQGGWGYLGWAGKVRARATLLVCSGVPSYSSKCGNPSPSLPLGNLLCFSCAHLTQGNSLDGIFKSIYHQGVTWPFLNMGMI